VIAHLYHIAQQKFRYEIVKNRSSNTQKRPYFDLKIANFLQLLGASPPDPIDSGSSGLYPQTPCSGYPNFSFLDHPSKFLRTLLVRTLKKSKENKFDPSELNNN